MQSCPKNADTGPLIGNGKGAPVVTGPGLSLPPSALVGPPSPARGLAGLAPPHGANAWDTDRVQLNPVHRSQQQQQQQQPRAASSSRAAPDKDKSTTKCEVKLEQSVSPASDEAGSDKPPSSSSTPSSAHQHHHHHHHHHHSFKLENNNVKCESRYLAIEDGSATASSTASASDDQQPRVGCLVLKCEQCVKEAGQLAIMEMDKDSGILEDDAGSGKLETDTEVKEELNALVSCTLFFCHSSCHV